MSWEWRFSPHGGGAFLAEGEHAVLYCSKTSLPNETDRQMLLDRLNAHDALVEALGESLYHDELMQEWANVTDAELAARDAELTRNGWDVNLAGIVLKMRAALRRAHGAVHPKDREALESLHVGFAPGGAAVEREDVRSDLPGPAAPLGGSDGR